MLLPHVREFFVFYRTISYSGIRASSMRICFVRLEHNELWALIFLLLPFHVYFDFAIWFDAEARTNFTIFGLRPVPHLTCNLYCTCGLRVSVTLTIVLTTFTKEGSYEIKKKFLISTLRFLCRYERFLCNTLEDT